MTAWLKRNALPVALVLLASALVVGAFELIDALSDSGPVTGEAAADELSGVASLAGLIKVSLFLGVGALIARPLRRRFRGHTP